MRGTACAGAAAAAAAGAVAIGTGTGAAGSAALSCAGCGAVSATEAPRSPLGFRLLRLRLTFRPLRFRLTYTSTYAATACSRRGRTTSAGASSRSPTWLSTYSEPTTGHHSLFCVPSSARQWSRARLAELFRAMVTKFDIKWVPQVHIRYRAKKYLAETKFRVADRITLWRIVLRGLTVASRSKFSINSY